MSSSSRILRTSRRIVLRSSMNSTSSSSATASVTVWASLLTLSRLNRTESGPSQNIFVFLYQFALNLAEHLLIVSAALLHFFGVSFEDDANFIVNPVLERQFVEQSGMYLL